jgi:hypothetical protein
LYIPWYRLFTGLKLESNKDKRKDEVVFFFRFLKIYHPDSPLPKSTVQSIEGVGVAEIAETNRRHHHSFLNVVWLLAGLFSV